MRKDFLAAAIWVGTLAAGPISVAADEIVGDSNTQTVTNTTTDNVSGNLILGNQSAGNGTYTITGDDASTNITFVVGGDGTDTSNPNGALIVGNAGTGTFTQGMADGSDAGNQVNVQGDLALGVQSGSVGIYTLNSGTLSVIGQVSVGGQSTGNNQFIQNGGTLNVNTPSTDQNNPDYVGVGSTLGGCASGPSCPYVGALSVGGGMGTGDYTNTGGSGSYTLNNDGIVNAYNVLIGGSGTGTMIQSGTSTVNTTFMTMGFNQETNGTYTLNGGTVNTYAATVGNYGTGTLTIGDGTDVASFNVTTTLDVGAQQGGSGAVIQNANSTVNDDLIVGDAGTGTYTNSGGVHNVTGDALLGNQSTGNGTYTITGDTAQLNIQFAPGGDGTGNTNGGPDTANANGALIVGEFGTGSFVQGNSTGTDAPTVTVAGDLSVGHQGLAGSPDSVPDSSGSYTINSGALTVGGSIEIGAASTGTNGANTFTQNGGTVTVTGSAGGDPTDYVGVGTSDHIGELFIAGGAGPDNDGGSGTYNMNNGTLNVGLIEDGHTGLGFMTQIGGTVNASIWLGNAGSGDGTYNFNGGIINAGSVDVGLFGNGTFTQTDGALSITNELDVGFESGQGVFNLNGGSVTSGTTIVGDGTGNGCCGVNFGGSGILNMSDGSLNTGAMTVGVFAQGTVNQSGGTVGAASLTVASAGSGIEPVDQYNLTGSSSVLTVNGDEIVGNLGNGVFVQGNGTDDPTHTISGTLFIGEGPNVQPDYNSPDDGNGSGPATPPTNPREGTFDLNSGMLSSNEAVVGDQGVGVFNHTGGTYTVSDELIVGNQNPATYLDGGGDIVGGPSQGTYNMTGGTLYANASSGAGQGIIIGNYGYGTFNQNGAASVTSGTLNGNEGDLLIGVQSGAQGSYDLGASSSSTTPSLQVYGDTIIGQESGSLGEMQIGGNGTSASINQYTGFTPLNGGNMVVGLGGDATVTQSDQSSVYLDHDLVLGANSASTGEYTLEATSTTANSGYNLLVGSDFNLGGFNPQSDIYGYNPQTTPTGGSGTFIQDSGDILVVGSANVGSTGSSGEYLQYGGTLAVNNNLNLGVDGGTGNFYQYAGSTTIGTAATDGNLAIGTQGNDTTSTAGVGNYTIGSGNLTVNGNVNVGQDPDSTGLSQMVIGFNGERPTVVVQSQNGGGYLTVGGASAATLNINSGSLSVQAITYAGGSSTGVGTITQNGGVFETNFLDIGNFANGGGSYLMNDGMLTVDANLVLGSIYVPGSSGTFTQYGGQVAAGAVYLNDTSLYALHDGSLTAAGDIFVGDNAGNAAEFDQSGGTVSAGGLVVGNQVGIGGTYNLTGGTLNDGAIIGNAGVGVFNNTGGAQVTGTPQVSGGAAGVEGDLIIGAQSTGQGTYNLGLTGQSTTPSLTVYGSVIIGQDVGSNAGTIPTSHNGSVPASNPNLVIAGNGSNLSVYYNGGSSDTNPASSDINVGLSGNGAVVQTDASTVYTDGNVNVGVNAGSLGSYDLNATKIGSGMGQGTANLFVGQNLEIGGVINYPNNADPMTTTSGGDGVFDVTSGTLQTVGNIDLGNNGGNGHFNQTGGSVFVGGQLYIANVSSGYTGGPSSAHYNMTGGTLNANSIIVGALGTGVFNESNGASVTDNGILSIGQQIGGTGTLTVAGTTTTWDNTVQAQVGTGGNGTLNVLSGAYFESDADGSSTGSAGGLGINTGSTGTATVAGTKSEWNMPDGALRVGVSSAGSANGSAGNLLTIENGGVVYDNAGKGSDGALTDDGAAGSVGWRAGSVGTVDVETGGTWTNYGDVVVGDAGTGTVYVDHTSTISVGGNLILGNLSTGNGTLTFDDASSLSFTPGSQFIVGNAGTGVATQNGGVLNLSGSSITLAIGSQSGSTGTYNLNGGSLEDALIVGNAGTGTFNNTGGTHTVTGNLTLGNQSTGNGSYNLSSTGSLGVSGNEIVGASGTGKFDQTGGTNTATGSLIIQQNPGSTGEYDLSSGTLSVANITNNGTLKYTGGTLGTVGMLANNGSITLGATQNIVVSTDYTNANFGSGNSFNKDAGLTTSGGQIEAAGNVGVSVTGTGGTVITGGTTTTPTLALGNVRVGTTMNATFNVNNTGSTGPVLRGAIQNTGLTAAGLSLTAANFGPIALGGSQAETLTADALTAGSLSGQSFNVVTNFGNVQNQTVSVTGTAFRLATGSATTPDNLGNVRINGSLTGNINVTNTAATDGFSEKLDASITGSTPQVSSTSGSVTGLVAGASNNSGLQVALNTATAGAISGTATVQFQSDGTGIDGGAPVNNGSQVVNVSGNVYRLATGSATTPDNLGNVRIGGTLAGNISVTNTAAADNFSENLDASITGSTPQVSSTSGSVTGLVAGASNNTGLQVALNTATAGAISGTATVQFQSDGTGIDGGAPVNNGSQVVNVSGNVYRLANGSATTPDNLGNVHVGGTLAGNINVTNTAAADNFSEKLDASITGSTPQVSSTSGSVTGLVAGASNNSGLQVALNTATAGAISGTATVQFQSDGTGIDGGAPVNHGSQVVNVTGNVYNLASSSTIAPINLGVLHVGQGGGSYSQGISITNTAPTGAYSEGLDSSFGSYTNSGGSLNPTFAGSITNLTAGSTDSASMQVTLNTGTAGTVSGNIIIHQDSNGTIDGLANTALADQNPSVSGSVTATITNLAVAQINNSEPISLGNVRVGTVVPTVGVSVTNAAPNSSFTEGLIGNVTGATGVGITAGGGFGPPTANPELAGQQTDSSSIQVGLNTSVAGHQSGSAVIDFKSDGTAFMGGTITDLGDTDVAAVGNVYRLATGSATTPDSLGNVRIGGVLAGNINVTNTAAADGFSENLDASITGSTPQVSSTSGSVTGLAAGSSNNSGLQVALNTATAGAISGAATVQFQSDGTGIDGGAPIDNGSQVVTVTGDVYRLATGSATTPDSLGNVRVGGTLSGDISVTNTAAADGFSENLDASITGSTPQVSSTGGAVTGLTAGSSNSSGLQVALNTAAAGAISGTATVQFQSDGTGIDGGAPIDNGSQVVTVTGDVYRLATGSATTPDSLGNVRVGGTLSGDISVTNTAAADGFSENLDASITGSTPQVSSTGGAVTGLTAGSSNSSGLQVALNTATAGAISGTATVQFQSDGTGIDGFAAVNNGSQVVTVTGNVYRLATGSAATPDSLGNVRVGGTLSGDISVTNTAAADGFSENLDASITGSTPQVSSTGGAVTGLTAGSSNSSGLQVALNTATAGAISGTATVQFQSDGAGIDGYAAVNNGSQVVTVTGNVYRLATGSAATPDSLGATRVGGSLTGNVSVTNTAAADGYSENLDASITGSTPQVSSTGGSVTGLAAGSTNNSGLQVALNTSTSGVITGTATVQFQSDGSGIDGGAPVNNGSQVVTVTGKVYQEAVASVAPNPVNFGIIHVNQAGVQTLTVSNTAGGALTDVITGGFSSVTGSFTGSGTLGGGVAAGSNSGSALQVGLDVGTAGSYTGTANLGLNSHDADLADVALTTAGVALEAQVNNYASLYFSQTGGQGSLSGGGDAYTLNFGNLLQDADGGTVGAILEFLNCPTCNPAFTDLLSSAVTGSTGSGFSLSGDSVSDLAGNASQGGFDIGLSTDALGQFDETLTFDVDSSDPDFNGVIGDVTLTLEGNIQSSVSTNVPEAPSLMIFGAAIFGLGVLGLRRRRKKAA